jgi:hypothetical protein
MPIDEEELDRIDMSHAKYVMLLEKKLFLAPITSQPQRILDLGTGTGKLCHDDLPEYHADAPCRNMGNQYGGFIPFCGGNHTLVPLKITH